jgi:hypothetical protein
MDAEFINLFLQKQKTLIDDLQQRLLLSETKLSLVEQKLEESNKIVDSLNKKASKKVE